MKPEDIEKLIEIKWENRDGIRIGTATLIVSKQMRLGPESFGDLGVESRAKLDLMLREGVMTFLYEDRRSEIIKAWRAAMESRGAGMNIVWEIGSPHPRMEKVRDFDDNMLRLLRLLERSPR